MAITLTEDIPVTTKSAFALLFLSLATATGCSQTMNTANAGSVKAKLNPHPQQRYELLFSVHGAPRSFDSASADAGYEVWNDGCVPLDPISGAHSKTPGLRVPIALTRISENVYQGVVELDLPLDEDYFGLGVCRWRANGAVIKLKSNDVNFNASLSTDDIKAESEVATYFLKSEFDHHLGAVALSYDGRYVAPEVKTQTDKFFYVTVKAKRTSP